MKNADKFKNVFGLYATEVWSMPEGEFLRWLNSESTEIEQRWIPCSERLPEKCGVYLVSGGSGVWLCELVQIMTVYGWANDARNPVVTAWMPLPEPYRIERRKDENNQNQTEHTWRHKNSNESPDIL